MFALQYIASGSVLALLLAAILTARSLTRTRGIPTKGRRYRWLRGGDSSL